MTQQIQSAIVHERQGGAFNASDLIYDAAGTLYVGAVTGEILNNNITYCDLYVVPRGAQWPSEPTYRVNPVRKIDTVALFNTGRTLVIEMTTHQTGAGARAICVELAHIDNIFSTTPAYEAERGGPGGFTGDGAPAPEADVDYSRIETIVRGALGAPTGQSLVQAFGGGSVRNGLEEKSKDALNEMFDPNNHEQRAEEFKFRYGQFVKDRVYEVLRDNGLLGEPKP